MNGVIFCDSGVACVCSSKIPGGAEAELLFVSDTLVRSKFRREVSISSILSLLIKFCRNQLLSGSVDGVQIHFRSS